MKEIKKDPQISNIENINLDVKVEKYKPTLEDITNYLAAQRSGSESGKSNLNNYLQQTYFKDQNVTIIADLSGMDFNNKDARNGNGNIKLIDLKGVDFSASIIKDTKFTGCDLQGAIFRDTDLNNAKFEKTKLKEIDFRGSDLANCQFVGYKLSRELGEKAQADYLGGIKYSTTQALGRQYADIKGDLVRQAEKGEKHDLTNREAELLANKQKEVDEAYKNLSKTEYAWYLAGRATGNKTYDNAATELKDMQAGKFPEPARVMNKSFNEIFSSINDVFDSSYTRGSNTAQANSKKEYVKLDRQDLESYLTQVKENPNLSLNDFAKDKFLKSNQLVPDTVVIADCSSSGNLKNKINRLDLSGLDFSGANLSGVTFAGSNLSGCNFTSANISKSSFEGAIFGKDPEAKYEKDIAIKPAIFKNTTAIDTNFFGANIEAAIIEDSNFKRSFMSKSNATGAKLENVNFDYSNIKDGKWDHTKIKEATFNFANLEGISLANADIQRTQAQHAILNKAILKNCEIIESDFTKAYMSEVNAEKAKFNDTILKEISAKKINLSEAELKGFTTLEGADLDKAIMQKINAERINFMNAKMNEIDGTLANLAEANLKNVEAKLANLDKAILNKINAEGIDMSGAKLNEAKAHSANFREATMRGVEAIKGDFLKSDFTEADLKDCNLKKAILEQVNLEKAKVNANTNIAQTNIKDAKGTLENYDHKGNHLGQISIEDQQKKSNDIENARSAPWYKKLGGKIAEVASNALETAREYAGKAKEAVGNFISKYGKIAGAIVGAVVVAGVVASAVVTAGASLPIIAVSIGAGLAVGAAAGAGTAHYIQKQGRVGAAAGAVIGGATFGAVGVAAGAVLGDIADRGLEKATGIKMGAGTALGVTLAVATGGVALTPALIGTFVGMSTDVIVEKATGKSITQLGKDGYQGLIDLCNKGAEKCGNTPEIKAMLLEANKCQDANKEYLNNVKQELDKSQANNAQTLEDKKLINNIAKEQNIQITGLDHVLNNEKSKNIEQKSSDIEKTQEYTKVTDIIKERFSTKNNIIEKNLSASYTPNNVKNKNNDLQR